MSVPPGEGETGMDHTPEISGDGQGETKLEETKNLLSHSGSSPGTSVCACTNGEVEKEPGYNDAWLRAVAYQMLFSFQTSCPWREAAVLFAGQHKTQSVTPTRHGM